MKFNIKKYEIKDVRKKKEIISKILGKKIKRIEIKRGEIVKISDKLYIGVEKDGKIMLYVEEE